MVRSRGKAPAMAKNRSGVGKGLFARNSMAASGERMRHGKGKGLMVLQDFLCTPEYLLKKVFRKDGPPIGAEFDSLPSQAFHGARDTRNTCPVVKEKQRVPKRKKAVKPVPRPKSSDAKNCTVQTHGLGKGLMTVWRVTNPGGGNLPTGIEFLERTAASVARSSSSRKEVTHKKRPRQQKPVMRRLGNKQENKKKSSVKRKKVECDRGNFHKKICRDKCELAVVGERYEQCVDQRSELVDDEELELRELQAGPNPLTCSAHVATNGWNCCSLCKDLLAKFPPDTVRMKHPLFMQPWNSSPGLVKKLFKVFYFLYTYAEKINIVPFTIDEFAKAFHDKDSLLIGKIHVSLLKFLLSSVDLELSNGSNPRGSKNFLFLGLLHAVEHQDSVVKLWKKYLNPLTWTEILRQVLVAAGFGSKEDTLRRKYLNKGVDFMVTYGLQPGTLKSGLFSILSDQGNNGMKVSDLAKYPQIVELNLAGTNDELELIISSTLASDITLFEKIASSTYRLRIKSGSDDAENMQSDNEDSGSVDDAHCTGIYSSDSDCDPSTSDMRKHKHTSQFKGKNMLDLSTEIDESNSEEAWLLGLMEGEYSDLSLEEKLDALAALVDLLSSGTSIMVEEPLNAIEESNPRIHVGSGAKIKRSSPNEHNLLRSSWGEEAQLSFRRTESPSDIRPIDSSVLLPNFSLNGSVIHVGDSENEPEVEVHLHPMQSMFLGSDRRYNRYWLFLGPCCSDDPGHKRVYFESSEDGHWEVIDTEQALSSLLSALDNRGKREALLLASLKKRETFLRQAMSSRINTDAEAIQFTQSAQSERGTRESSSSPVSDVDNNPCLIDTSKDFSVSSDAMIDRVEKAEEDKLKWSRLQALDAWIWNYFYCNLNVVKHCKRSYFDTLMRCESCHDLYWRDEKHCKVCHTTFELDFDLDERYAIHAATCREREDLGTFPKHKVLSSQLQALKAAIHAIESFMPKNALIGAWTKSAHNLWIKRLRRTSSVAELMQVLSDFVGAIRKEWMCQSESVIGVDMILEEIVVCFPGVLQTSSAIALWLVKLDFLIAPYLETVQSEKIQELCTRTKRRACPKQ